MKLSFRLNRHWLAGMLFVLCGGLALASSVIRLATPELVQESDAVCRGRVVELLSFKDVDGLIYTRALVEVDEVFKGRFPQVVQLIHRGGQVEGEGELYGFSPQFNVGSEYLLFLARTANGRLQSLQGAASAILLEPVSEDASSRLAEVRAMAKSPLEGADVRDQAGPLGPYVSAALSGMMNNIHSRFIQPDRGEPIPYIIDADVLPAGITLEQATNAVLQAVQAWMNVSSVKLRFEGFESFGKAADEVVMHDGKLRIQLHDSYGGITSSTVLGIGGRAYESNVVGPGWGRGGSVNGTEFHKSSQGFVVLEHTHASMQNAATMAEVLCHEIGHALNLAHSSEVVTADPVLSQAMMYFQAHIDGRGATLGTYDPPVIRQIYPSNTPPYLLDRYLDVVTAFSAFNISGINEADMSGFDLQSTSLTVATNSATTNYGRFALTGKKIRYIPNGAFNDSSRAAPDSSYYAIIYARVSDGTNASPYASVGVVSYTLDSGNTPDGLPDSWMETYFGHDDPRSGDRTRASDDFDRDGVTNFNEYLAGTNPANSNSVLRISSIQPGVLQFNGRPYEAYEILGSSNLTSWVRVGGPVVPTDGTPADLTAMPQVAVPSVISNVPMSAAHQFLRIRKLP